MFLFPWLGCPNLCRMADQAFDSQFFQEVHEPLHRVAPGEHHVCVDWQSSLKSRQKLSGAAELTAEAGKTYYFRAEVVLTQATESHDERLSIKAVDAPEGMLLVSKSSLSAWKTK